MTGHVAQLWRHPIKAHGAEQVERAGLTAGQTFPGDRIWAVAHERSEADGSEWARCMNFSRGAGTPQLMAIRSQLEDATGVITLSHPDLPDLRFDPATNPDALIEWSRPLMVEGRAHSARLIRAPGRAMTDSDRLSISIGNLASHRVIEQRLGIELSVKRWRCNIWLDGLPIWEEFDWIGKTIRLGQAHLAIREPITRCRATTTNPETGMRDADTLGALGEDQQFCVDAEVVKSGVVEIGATVEVL